MDTVGVDEFETLHQRNMGIQRSLADIAMLLVIDTPLKCKQLQIALDNYPFGVLFGHSLG